MPLCPQIPYELVDRRPGDVASCYASCSLAEKELGWRAQRNLRDMCKLVIPEILNPYMSFLVNLLISKVDVPVFYCTSFPGPLFM